MAVFFAVQEAATLHLTSILTPHLYNQSNTLASTTTSPASDNAVRERVLYSAVDQCIMHCLELWLAKETLFAVSKKI